MISNLLPVISLSTLGEQLAEHWLLTSVYWHQTLDVKGSWRGLSPASLHLAIK